MSEQRQWPGYASTVDGVGAFPAGVQLPFDPSTRSPAPTMGAQEKAAKNGSKAEKAPAEPRDGSWWSNLASWQKGGVIVGGLIVALLGLPRLFGGSDVNTTVNLPDSAASPTTTPAGTADTPQVPLAAIPFGQTIGGYEVRPSALMVINGEVQNASIAVLDWLSKHPGMTICQVYVGTSTNELAGFVLNGARTDEAEVKLVDCNAPAQTVPNNTVAPETTTTAPA